MCGGKGIGSPYSITERRVPELIPVLGSQPAGDVSHKPGVDSFTERSNKNNPFGFWTSRQCYSSCTGCQSVNALCSRSRG